MCVQRERGVKKGIILAYIFIFLYFWDDNWQKVLKSHAKTKFSSAAIELIQGMMQYDPHLRFKIEKCLSSPNFKKLNIADIPSS